MRRPARAFLLALLLAAPAAASAASGCEAAWQDSYASDWEFPRDEWMARCRASLDPNAALREAQSAFMAKCKERFSRPDARAAAAQAEIYCALGKPGRSKLYALAGLPDEDAPKPAPKPAEQPHASPPGTGGMGSLMQALRDARAKWKPDACFSGLEYTYNVTPLTTDAEWKRAYKAKVDPAYSITFLEVHEYAFHSEQVKLGGYRVTYGDHVDTATCTDLARHLGPDVNGFAHVPFYARCLSQVRLDVRQALAVVFPQGAPVERVFAMLGTLTADFLSGPGCEVVRTGRDSADACAGVPGWDARSLRPALGREVWAIVVGERTDFVDAADGKRLGWARGALRARSFSRSGLYGGSCPVPTIIAHP